MKIDLIKGETYNTVRNQLTLYNMSGTPVLCGYGVEVYESETVRMVVDLNSNTLTTTMKETT